MAKKYQPSGYQIINVDLKVDASGSETTNVAETEDEKLLNQLLRYGMNKPILLKAHITNEDDGEEFEFIAFPTYIDGKIVMGDTTANYSPFCTISYSGNNLLVSLNEQL